MSLYDQLGTDPKKWPVDPMVSDLLTTDLFSQIRNRGTFGGSLAHADPASELPALAIALEMKMAAQSVRGKRWIAANK